MTQYHNIPEITVGDLEDLLRAAYEQFIKDKRNKLRLELAEHYKEVHRLKGEIQNCRIDIKTNQGEMEQMFLDDNFDKPYIFVGKPKNSTVLRDVSVNFDPKEVKL
jgi:hypothetical protein